MQIFGEHEKRTLAQLERVAERAEHAALMADGHLGYVMPIGGVAAYRNQVSVAGVGFDIACGNAAVRTDLGLDDLRDRPGGLRRNLERIGDEVRAGLTFGVGGTNRSPDAPSDHPLFADPAWEAVPAGHRSTLLAKARKHERNLRCRCGERCCESSGVFAALPAVNLFRERSAMQVLGCDGETIAGHVPISQTLMAEIEAAAAEFLDSES